MADTYSVERSIQVTAPAAAVYERLADFRRWRAWSPFEELDPGMDRTFTGAERGVGAVYEWAGNLKSGTGRMEITQAEPGRLVTIDQRNTKPFKSSSTTAFTLTETGGATTVTWIATGPTTRMTKVMGLFTSMEKVLGPVFEQGLARLKADAES